MGQVEVKDLLVAGVHFGHQTRRWNPKMRRYIFGERSGSHIIDLEQSAHQLETAIQFVRDLAARGGIVLLVGTKKQARDAIREVAEQSGMPYVNHRWLGGLLTNFQTISKRIKRLHELNELKQAGQLDLLPVRERLSMEAEREKLTMNLGGVADMPRLPEAAVIVDLKAEEIAVREASRLGIPIIGLVDTNCDPGPIEYVIPGNDDAIRSCEIVIRGIGGALAEGRAQFMRQETARQEAEEKARREAEEKARSEAEEKALKEAEEKARAEAAGETSAAEGDAEKGGPRDELSEIEKATVAANIGKLESAEAQEAQKEAK